MSTDDRLDASTLLNDPLAPFDPDYVPLAAIVIVEALDPTTGDVHLLHRRSTGPEWAQVGMLLTVADGLRHHLQHGPHPDEDSPA